MPRRKPKPEFNHFGYLRVSIINFWIRDYDRAQSKKRSIDGATLCDFLSLIEYEAERTHIMDEIRYIDNRSAVEALYTYVLNNPDPLLQ